MNAIPPNTTTPTAAGVYDAALGGTTNTAADRAMLDHARSVMPHVIEGAWANRGFLQRAVKHMASQWGIQQFLDLGSGMPTQRNTHEVVAEHRPDGRVVYVDSNAWVVEQSQQLLAGVSTTVAIQADVRNPEVILNHPQTRRLIDFSQPLGLLMVAVTHFIPDDDDPWTMVSQFVDAMAPGSYLALSAVTCDHQEEVWNAVLEPGRQRGYEGFARTKPMIERFFDGLEIMPPYEGAKPEVTYLGLWGAEDPQLADDDSSRLGYAAVGRKPACRDS